MHSSFYSQPSYSTSSYHAPNSSSLPSSSAPSFLYCSFDPACLSGTIDMFHSTSTSGLHTECSLLTNRTFLHNTNMSEYHISTSLSPPTMERKRDSRPNPVPSRIVSHICAVLSACNSVYTSTKSVRSEFRVAQSSLGSPWRGCQVRLEFGRRRM